ncbi:protein PFC0760c-like [Cydia fagiglandana]|uniref:protein PFC0760c-like n=1 Tax=Cydia fagiglandana TaxID=1458189 RepID=UPI002FEE13A0
MLLTGGQLEPLGTETNTYIATRLLILEKYPMQALHDFFDVLQRKLAQRTTKLSKEVNDILDYMDDTYDEAEEDAMQAVLHETNLYPNTKNYNKIAQGFVDYVFLKPLIRLAGTSRGNVLFKMINDAVIQFAKPGEIRLSPEFHKNLRKSFRKRQNVRYESSSDTSTDTEENNGSNESLDLSNISKSLSESSNTITSSDEEDESSNEETRMNYQFKNNKLVKTENFKKQNIFSNSAKSRKIKSYEVLSKLRPIQRKHYGAFDNNEEIRRNSYQHFLSRTSTTNNANVIKDTEYSDIERVLKSKIYDSFRRMDNINYNTHTTLKQKLTSQVNEHEQSSETDYERELKRNIYKAVNKLLNK